MSSGKRPKKVSVCSADAPTPILPISREERRKKEMELRNPYLRSPNFSILASSIPSFAPLLTFSLLLPSDIKISSLSSLSSSVKTSPSGPTIDFKDPIALRLALASLPP